MDIFDLSAKITLDSSEFEKGVRNAENGMDGLSVKAVALGNAIYDIGKEAVSAFGKLSKSALDGFADYQQLVGGIDTLFKESSEQLQAYADMAFKTAGLSANKYMETATSFAASLVSGLGGDTAAAVEYANMAITDMSDNANKMGSNIESIQNAYQGFAKQNYSMLDNLKLGFGGTAAEMFRLLETAAELDASFDAVFSLDAKGHLEAEFADIVEAIHVVQTEMGITGTTALEASETISGSVATMKGAWENWLAGLGNADADMSGLTNNLIESVRTAASNILPIVYQIGNSLGQVFTDLTGIDLTPFTEKIDTAKTTVKQLFGEIKTSYEENGVDGVFDTLTSKVENLTKIDFSPFTAFIKNFAEETPAAIEATATAFGKLAEAAGENASGVIGATADNTSRLLQSFTDTAADRIHEAADGVGELADIASENNETFSVLAGNISDFLAPFTDVVALAVDSISQDAVALVKAFTKDAARNAVSFADGINKLFEYLEPFVEYMEDSTKIITDFIDVVKDSELTAREKGEAIGKIFSDAAASAEKAWDDTLAFFEGLPNDIYECFGGFNIGNKFKEIGSQIVGDIKSGISNAWGSLTGFVSGLWDGLFDKSKDDNDINSPSGRYESIGINIGLGVGVGLDKSFKTVAKQMDDSWDSLSDTLTGVKAYGTVDFASSSLGKSSSAQINTMLAGMQEQGGSYNINLVVDGRTLANVVFDPLNEVSKQKGVALSA